MTMASNCCVASSMPAWIMPIWSSPSEFILLWNSRHSDAVAQVDQRRAGVRLHHAARALDVGQRRCTPGAVFERW